MKNESVSKKIIIKTEEVLVVKKKTPIEFIATELAIYISQIFMFFIVTAMTSNFLRDETALSNYMNAKLNAHSLEEVGFVILATVITIGIFSAIAKALKNSEWLDSLSEEVLNEVPRAIYFFGSSVAGVLLGAATFIHKHPEVKAPPVSTWLYIAFIWGLGAFFYGCGLSFAFKNKTHIRKAP